MMTGLTSLALCDRDNLCQTLIRQHVIEGQEDDDAAQARRY